MKLSQKINHTEFINNVKKCEGDVHFISSQGDHLNLKSTLSQFLFGVAANTPDLLLMGEIYCDVENDYELLKKYCEEF